MNTHSISQALDEFRRLIEKARRDAHSSEEFRDIQWLEKLHKEAEEQLRRLQKGIT